MSTYQDQVCWSLKGDPYRSITNNTSWVAFIDTFSLRKFNYLLFQSTATVEFGFLVAAFLVLSAPVSWRLYLSITTALVFSPFPLLCESQLQTVATQSHAPHFIDGFKRRNLPVFLPGSFKVTFSFFSPCIWSLGPFHLGRITLICSFSNVFLIRSAVWGEPSHFK